MQCWCHTDINSRFYYNCSQKAKIKVLHGEKSPTNALAIKHMDKFFKCINRICSNREDPLVPEWMIDHGEQHQREHL